MSHLSIFHCKVDEFPMVSEWLEGARDPILENIVLWGYCDTFQIKVSFLTGYQRGS
jgi:hypothetical protein